MNDEEVNSDTYKGSVPDVDTLSTGTKRNNDDNPTVDDDPPVLPPGGLSPE